MEFTPSRRDLSFPATAGGVSASPASLVSRMSRIPCPCALECKKNIVRTRVPEMPRHLTAVRLNLTACFCVVCSLNCNVVHSETHVSTFSTSDCAGMESDIHASVDSSRFVCTPVMHKSVRICTSAWSQP